ncbi:MAG: phosphoribosylglycinamide formyltransferase [Mycetocola sp.]
MLSVVVLISGTGSNLRALLEAAAAPDYPARIVAVGADRDAAGLAHATEFGIPAFTVPYAHYETRDQWGEALVQAVNEFSPDLVVLSGLMRLLPSAVVDAYAPNLINTHPAYLPEFPGAHGVRDALASGQDKTGASIIVVDSGVDTGAIIVRERVAIAADDTEASLHDRIKPVERRLLIDAVRDIADGRISLTSPATSSR